VDARPAAPGHPGDPQDAGGMIDPAGAPTDPEQRAAALDQRPELLGVRVGAVEFGLPLDRVLEVVRVPPITRLPFPPPSIAGVASVRGSLVPVMDLGVRLLGPSADPGGRLVVVADPAGGGEVALLVDAVTGLIAAGERGAEPPPEVEASLPPGWVAEVVTPAPDRLITVLRLEPVLALSDSADKERR
jgi:purine-binding chemotaxis protein CheW